MRLASVVTKIINTQNSPHPLTRLRGWQMQSEGLVSAGAEPSLAREKPAMLQQGHEDGPGFWVVACDRLLPGRTWGQGTGTREVVAGWA